MFYNTVSHADQTNRVINNLRLEIIDVKIQKWAVRPTHFFSYIEERFLSQIVGSPSKL